LKTGERSVHAVVACGDIGKQVFAFIIGNAEFGNRRIFCAEQGNRSAFNSGTVSSFTTPETVLRLQPARSLTEAVRWLIVLA
jgi:hypothetical protein